MISTQVSPKKASIFKWLKSLEDEVELLESLGACAANARASSPEEEGAGGLHSLLEMQAEICAALENHRYLRRQMLAEEGFRNDELVVVVLGALPKEEHPAAMDIFTKYFSAAEKTQREIDVNRDFFSVALASLEDTIEAVVSEVSSGSVYDASGKNSGDSTALCMSTMT